MNGEWVFVEGFNENGVFIEGTWHNGFFTASNDVSMSHGFHEMAMGTMNQGITDHNWVVHMSDKDDEVKIDDEPAEKVAEDKEEN